MTDKTKAPDGAQAAKQASKRLPQSFAEAAADFERSKIEELKGSRKLAWRIAGVAVAICSVVILGQVAERLIRKDPAPTVLSMDKATGVTTVLRPLGDGKDQYDEVLTKYWLSQYVRTCEGYDWYTISDQVEACKLMSESNVAKEQNRKVQAPDAPLNVLKDKGKVVVKIGSIVFMGDSAQVRWTAQKVNQSGENLDGSPEQKWISTVVSEFRPTERMTEQERLVNPLGLKVLTYRVDPEVVK